MPNERRLFLLLILMAGLVAYCNSFTVPFLFDDRYFILDPRAQAHFDPLWKVFVPPAHFDPRAHRPLVTLTLALNHLLGGADTGGYHFLNLAIHLANGLLLWALLRRIIGLRPAFAAALLWIVHPLNSQCVTYIYQRAESLMALCCLLTLYGLTRSAEEPGKKNWHWLAVGACAAGMLGKQTMVVVPALALLYDWTFLARGSKESLRERAGLHLALMSTWGILAALWIFRQRQVSEIPFTYAEIGPWQYARSQPGVFLYYLRLAFWPYPLVFDYGWPVAQGMAAILLPSAAVGGLALLTLWTYRRLPAAGFAGFWVFILLAPVSTIIPTRELLVEYRMYLPLAAILALTVSAGSKVLSRRQAAAALACAALALTAATFLRNRDYQSDVLIWEDTVRKRPLYYRSQGNAGIARLRAGQPALALPHLQEAVRLNPTNPEMRINYAVGLFDQKDPEEAMQQLKIALELQPGRAEALTLLDRVYRFNQRFPLPARSTPPSPTLEPPGTPPGPPER